MSRRPRCECCDEVLEELLGMRQNFEKFFHRFNSQIVELRRELRAVVSKSEAEESHQAVTNNANNSTSGIKRKATAARSDSPWSRGGSDDDASLSSIRTGLNQQQNVSKQAKYNSGTTQVNIKTESTPKNSSISNIVKTAAKRPVLDFFGIQLRVMPTCPFNSDVEFEQWESLLLSDEDQRDHLRVELMQGHFGDAEKFIKHIWSSVLGDNAAQCYSFRGNVKTDKKAVKDMTFTSIFKECFLQRYERHDSFFFVERTMRFFNYVHDRQRRISKVSQSSFEKIQLTDEPTMDGDADRSIDEDSLINDPHNDEEDGTSSNKDCTNVDFTDNVINMHELNQSDITRNDLIDTRRVIREDLKELGRQIHTDIREQEERLKTMLKLIAHQSDDVEPKSSCNNDVHVEPPARSSYKKINFEEYKNLGILPKEPYKDVEDFQKFENAIESDEKNFYSLIQQFGQLTAHSEKYIKVCWRMLITDSAAQHLCWKGTKRKIAVRLLSVTAALKAAYKKKFPQSKEADFERTCILFFKHAKTRFKKKTIYQNLNKSAQKEKKLKDKELKVPKKEFEDEDKEFITDDDHDLNSTTMDKSQALLKDILYEHLSD